ncbi:MAG: hypothetical protein QMD88_06985 [Coprothermobacterota bacterium]|nr:hypothetical protein [Coprothermobacterota bacterium]
MEKRLKDVRWFSSQKEALAWARSLGPEWRPWVEMEKPGFYRKAGWLVRIFEIKEDEQEK